MFFRGGAGLMESVGIKSLEMQARNSFLSDCLRERTYLNTRYVLRTRDSLQVASQLRAGESAHAEGRWRESDAQRLRRREEGQDPRAQVGGHRRDHP